MGPRGADARRRRRRRDDDAGDAARPLEPPRARPIDVGYPTAAQSAVVSPTAAACVAQDHLEAVLAEHLGSLAAATPERGVEVLDVTPTARRATVSLHDAAGRRDVRPSYVVAADGARSAVRTALGIEMGGPDGVIGGLRVEFRAPLWEVLGEHRHLLYAITETRPSGVLLPAGAGRPLAVRRSTWTDGSTTGRPSPTRSGCAFVRRGRRARPRRAHQRGRPLRRRRAARAAVLARQRLPGRRRRPPGDAARRHRAQPRDRRRRTTSAGSSAGCCAAGRAPSLSPATRPSGARPVTTTSSARWTRWARGASGQRAGRRPRRPGPHVWVDPGLSTLDLIGDGLTLFVAGEALLPKVDLDGPPVAVVSLAPVVARSFGLGPSGALLVRPDGRPLAGWWSLVDARAQVGRAMRSLLGDEPSADRIDPESAA